MKRNMAFKFRLYPTKEQEVLIQKTFGCCRFIYNKMLGDKISHYEKTKENYKCTPAMYKQEFQWLKEVDSLALANVQMDLQEAYSNFFRDKKVGFPKFKSKKKSRKSYTTNNQKGTISIIDKNHIKLPKLKSVKVKIHRNIPEDHIIKSATISQNACNQYFISILTEYQTEEKEVILDKNKALGLDYSSPHFYVDSQGKEADYPHYYRKSSDKLAREQRKMSKMVKFSNNWYKQKRKVGKIHVKTSNQRLDWIHKETKKISDKYDIVCLENINMKDMSQCLTLGKSTMDNGFDMFRDILSYKMAERGKIIVKIDKWFPSSKMCRFCGTVNKNLTLKDRVWKCDCGVTLERDVNAAINIREEGLRMI